LTQKNNECRRDYHYLVNISTRWSDNDVYGHVNNVVYYSYFDTVVNQYLIEEANLDIHTSKVVGFVVASSCEYRSPISYPDKIEVALRVNKLGNRSVEYGVGVFKAGVSPAIAAGTFTHVFVDRQSGDSTLIPKHIRQALERAFIEEVL